MGFLSRLLGTDGPARDLADDLAEAYRAEVAQAAHLREHAEQARYPQVAAELRRLAAVEDRHAGWLRDRLLALGREPPAIAPPPLPGQNQWARLVAVHEAARRKRRRLAEQVAHWDPDEPQTVALLARIEREDQHELGVYDGLIMRSDPQALD